MSMSDDAGDSFGQTGASALPPQPEVKPLSPRDRAIEALMELAAERDWTDFGIKDVATRAGMSLSEFRDVFPSKGAILAAFSRKIDTVVLDGTTADLDEESGKERLFDVLMRRLDAMAPYKLGLESVAEWVRGDLLAAAALNQVALNSMRFMLAAAGIETEGRTGSIKLQGVVVAWARVLNVWFEDDEPGLARTMAALDKELQRGATLSARVDDLDRLAPLRLLGRAVMDTRRRFKDRRRTGLRRDPDDLEDLDPAI